MDWNWVRYAAAAAMLTWGAGPRIGAGALAIYLVAVAVGISWLEAAGTSMSLAQAAAATHVIPFTLIMLVPTAAGVALGWGVRRVAPPPKGRLPRVTEKP
jgi:hypothetical protein